MTTIKPALRWAHVAGVFYPPQTARASAPEPTRPAIPKMVYESHPNQFTGQLFKLTPEATKQIKRLLKAGKTWLQIAEAIECPVHISTLRRRYLAKCGK